MSSGTQREINNYRLLELIGSGGMSKVWRARRPDSDRDVALKVIPVEDIAPDFERRLRREPEIHHSLRHENIVPLLDWFRDGDDFCLVMEFISGKSLSRLINDETGPLPFYTARAIMRAMLGAIRHLHENGVIHRDIKPGNILIDDEGWPWLTDFGIAKFAWQQGETRTQKGLGTPEYMSPEQVRGTNIDHRTDIYSLGITFFEILTGRKPFLRAEETPAHFAEVVGKILSQELPDPRQYVPGIPDGAVGVLRKATAKDPADRYQSCEEFLNALNMVDETVITPYRDPDATVVLNGPVPEPPQAVRGGETLLPQRDRQPVPPSREDVPAGDSGKRGLIISILLLVLAGGGFFGVTWYQQMLQEEMAQPLTNERAVEIADELARDYKRFSFDGNIDALATLYAPEGVEYFRMRDAGRDEIREDAAAFYARIKRTDRFDVEVSRVNVVDDSTLTTRWIIGYERLKDDGMVLRGEAQHELTIRRNGDEWLIVREKQKSIRRNNQAPPPPDTATVDTVAAEQTPDPEETAPVLPAEGDIRNAVKAIVLLANNGQSGQAWRQYASTALQGKADGFPAPFQEGSLSLRSVSVNGSVASAILVQSQGFAQKELTAHFTFASGSELKLSAVAISE